MPEAGTAADRDALAGLIARATLTDLLADYGQVMDWLAWDRLDAIFWPEAQFDFGMFQGDLSAYRGFVTTLEEGYTRRFHTFGLPVIRVEGDSAWVDTTSIIVCRTEDPAPSIDNCFWGRYLLRAERRDGVWRFIHLTYLLNLIERTEPVMDDSGLPMHFASGLSAAHPMAARI
ncbi:nuclear transport factor 2 family protein [Novosphingobium sp. FSY-8]|uniref:Nuclear transport factor 2 family protein n=1 Tax=Novosphingobium ovatum TaxID=1908523 RepID=A0ABW9XHP1_9SPHN|nr:nuclear transport factor 2 family protein [Novosphingobium ovatum]NBC38073.1 nuclear transport factor 2 family protein [Novosphingobium ovatum]